MNLLGLNGFGFAYGRIDRYFTEGCFPYRWNWGYRHAREVIRQYSDQYGDEPYIGIGFSDGATLLHEIAQIDMRCRGFIAHSGMFRLPRTVGYRRSVPCLLLRTRGDITPTFKATGHACAYYIDRLAEADEEDSILEMHTAPKTTWHGHEFANGLLHADWWANKHFGFPLPINWPSRAGA